MLKTEYQKFIHLSRYARWREDLGRRETWEETVDRYINFITKYVKRRCDFIIPSTTILTVRKSILDLEVMPSMRCLMTAGKALERDNAAAYNCAYLPIRDTEAFPEIMYLLMCGCGVGFSVERQEICNLPIVPEMPGAVMDRIPIEDSKIGWCNAFKNLITELYDGRITRYDFSQIRPAGAPLKTFGGRSSGPGPLISLFDFTISLFLKARGRKLTSIECHDICCKIGEIVIVGGVRRSALISLSNLSDDRMRKAKSGNWPQIEPQRALANNSVAYTEKPDIGRFMIEWISLYDSKSGERGIFNRESANNKIKKTRREAGHNWGLNPCGEVILRPYQFCNLTEVIVKPTDSLSQLMQKIDMAAILGTLQSTLTDFRFLRPIWKKNTEEERLLGVSLTGVFDNKTLLYTSEDQLRILRDTTSNTNSIWAEHLKIPQSAAITTIKPSGNVSQLCNCSSGFHPSFNKKHYVRTVRANIMDPLTKFMMDHNFPYEYDMFNPKTTVVFSFPIKGKQDSVSKDELLAIEYLELWKKFYHNWSDHQISATVYIKEHEWIQVASWVYENFDDIGGLSFLPYDDHIYKQAPYQDCTKQQFEALQGKMPKGIKWGNLSLYESKDNTTGSQELACTGNKCEVL